MASRRMTGAERREQLVSVACKLFADTGYEHTTVDDVAAEAGVTKPVVYEHFGGKEGLYAVVVDREVTELISRINGALNADNPKTLIGQAADALLSYIEEEPAGFRVLVREGPFSSTSGYATLISDIADRVTVIFASEFKKRKLPVKLSAVYAHALVGMVAMVGQWWLENQKIKRAVLEDVLVALAWNGLAGIEVDPGD